MKVITFTNHAPIRVGHADRIEIVWDADWDFGHHELLRYVTDKGKALYWASRNSGQSYGNHEPKTTRTYLSTIQAVRDYFEENDLARVYHAQVEAKIDGASIVDVDAL